MTSARKSPPLREILRDPRLALMLALGFSSGLPFLLIFSTQSAWLREAGVSRSAIGLMSYAALAFTFKFAWAPFIDEYDPPLVGAWLGRRRGWMLIAQIGVAAGLSGLAFGAPAESLGWSVALRVPDRLRRREPGRHHRRLAHRRGADRAPGHDVGGVPARLSPGDALRRGRRALHRRFRELARRLSRDGGADAGRNRRLPCVAAARPAEGSARASAPLRSPSRSSSRSAIFCAATALR